MNTITKSRTATYTIFFILLISRIWINTATFIDLSLSKQGAIPAWFNLVRVPNPWIYSFYIIGTVPLLIIVILLNRENLQSLNIDQFFILLLIYSGWAVFLEYLIGLGCVPGIPAAAFTIFVLSKNNLKFGAPNPNLWKFILIVSSAFAICFIVVSGSINLQKLGQNIYLILVETIPGVVYEEAIYRGLLWMFLKNLKLSDPKIMLFTSFLFWLSHLDHLALSPLSFWITTPLFSLLYGYIVLKTKSLGLSTIVHLMVDGLIMLTS